MNDHVPHDHSLRFTRTLLNLFIASLRDLDSRIYTIQTGSGYLALDSFSRRAQKLFSVSRRIAAQRTLSLSVLRLILFLGIVRVILATVVSLTVVYS